MPMPDFIHYDYNQTTMIVVNFKDQIQAGTFEYAIHYLITNTLDLSIFNPQFKNDDNGRPAFDPAKASGNCIVWFIILSS